MKGFVYLVYLYFHCFNTVNHEDGISILGTDRSQKEPYQENMGVRKDFKSTFSRSTHSNLWRVSRCVVVQVQNTASQFPCPCLVISWPSRLDSLDKIAGIIFIAKKEIPRNIKPSLFGLSVNIRGAHLTETFAIPKMMVRIDCSALKRMPTSLAGSLR